MQDSIKFFLNSNKEFLKMRIIKFAAVVAALLVFAAMPAKASEECVEDTFIFGHTKQWSPEIPYFYGKQKGFYENEGVCMKLRLIAGGSKAMLAALKNKEVHAVSPLTVAPRCLKFGFDCVIATTFSRHPQMVMLGRKGGPTTLESHSIPVGRCKDGIAGGLQATILRLLLADTNVSLRCGASVSTNVVRAMAAGRGREQVKAFEQGATDFVLAFEHLAAKLVVTGDYQIVIPNRKLPATASGNGPTVRRDFYEANRDLVAGFVLATNKAVQAMLEDPELGDFLFTHFRLDKKPEFEQATNEQVAKAKDFLSTVFKESFSNRKPLTEAELTKYFKAYFADSEYELPPGMYTPG